MKKLEMKKMERIEGGCPGIECIRVNVPMFFFDYAVCYNACDGSFLYAEPW